MKVVEEFNKFLYDYDISLNDVDIRIEELTVISSDAMIHGEVYIRIDGLEYSGWFSYNLLSWKFLIEDTLIESLVQETYNYISYKDFIDFFESNLITFIL